MNGIAQVPSKPLLSLSNSNLTSSQIRKNDDGLKEKNRQKDPRETKTMTLLRPEKKRESKS